MFKGSLVALITPFRNGGVDESRVSGAGRRGRSDRARTGWCRAAPPANRRRSTMTSTSGSSSCASRWPSGRVPVIAGTGSNSTDADDRTDPAGQGGRRRRRAGRLPLLQQADAGRALPAFQGDPRRGRSADRHLQHSRPLGGRHERTRRWRGSPSCPTSSASRMRPTTSPGRSRCGSRSAASFRCCRARTRPPSPIWRRAATAASRSPPMSRRGCCSEMHEAWQKGDVATVRRINERLIPLHDALFAETSPAPVKYAASLLGQLRSRRCACRCGGPRPRRRSGCAQAMRGAGLLN